MVSTEMPPPQATTVAILLAMEAALTEQLSLVGKAAYRRRLEIEAELADVRLQLARLGVLLRPLKVGTRLVIPRRR
jgi:hypothetical protein